jgi:hypothetical protein
VNDAGLVRSRERLEQPVEQRDDVGDGERVVGLEVVLQRLAFEQLHHQERPAVGQHVGAEDVDDGGVPNRVHHARLFEQPPRFDDRLAGRRAHHLDGDALANHRVHRLVHLTHRASAELAHDFVFADWGACCEGHREGRP